MLILSSPCATEGRRRCYIIVHPFNNNNNNNNNNDNNNNNNNNNKIFIQQKIKIFLLQASVRNLASRKKCKKGKK